MFADTRKYVELRQQQRSLPQLVDACDINSADWCPANCGFSKHEINIVRAAARTLCGSIDGLQ